MTSIGSMLSPMPSPPRTLEWNPDWNRSYTAAQCVAASGAATFRQAYRALFDQACALGLLPEEPACIRAMLGQFGFVMQSTRLEELPLQDLLGLLDKADPQPMAVIAELDWRGPVCQVFPLHGTLPHPELRPNQENWKMPDNGKVHHVWVRTPGGQTPLPRRQGKAREPRPHQPPRQAGMYLQYYQPNPMGRSTGDCVIRGLSAVLDISWQETLRRLARYGHTRVNCQTIYKALLLDEKFTWKPGPVLRGRYLSGAEFCREMSLRCTGGQRILASLGRSHVAAVIPVRENSGDQPDYRVLDSWDSTDRPVIGYWISPPCRSQANTAPQTPRMLQPGCRIIHPVFGTGTLLRPCRAVQGEWMEIDFGSYGVRCLGGDWVAGHCRVESARQAGRNGK